MRPGARPHGFPIARVAMLAAFLVATAACTIGPESAPRDVPADERGLLVTGGGQPTVTAGDGRIYLVSPSQEGQARQLRSVQRDVVAAPDELLDVLLGGPTQSELDARLVSAIPADTELRSTRTVGETLFVDVSAELLELTGEALTLAVAQIVFTASEIPGVQTVRLRVEGEDQSWPRGDGQARPGSLRVFDFPGVVESAQPAYPGIPG